MARQGARDVVVGGRDLEKFGQILTQLVPKRVMLKPFGTPGDPAFRCLAKT
jgi:hypothetical protein